MVKNHKLDNFWITILDISHVSDVLKQFNESTVVELIIETLCRCVVSLNTTIICF